MANYVSHPYNATATGIHSNITSGSTFCASHTSTDGTVSVIVIGDNASGNIGIYSNSGFGLYITRNSGTTWGLVKMPNTTAAVDVSNWSHGGFGMSKDGIHMCCCVTQVPGNNTSNSFVYYSHDKGVTWTQGILPPRGNAVIGLATVSDDGKYMFISSYEAGFIWTTSTSGGTWYNVATPGRIFASMQCVCSTNGEKLFRGVFFDADKRYFYSTNFGTNYTQLAPNQSHVAYNMCANDDMTKIIVLHDTTNVVTIFNGTDLSVTTNWTFYTTFSTTFGTGSTYAPRHSICSSSDLKYVVMQCTSIKCVFSSNYGVTWVPFDLPVAAKPNLYSMSMSNSGKMTYMKDTNNEIITVKLHKVITNSGISVSDLISGGESISSLLADGYTVQQLLSANVSVSQLLAAGVPVSQLLAANVSASQLLAAGIPFSQLLNYVQWLDLSATSNIFNKSYVNNFIDLSGDLFIRNDGALISGGDVSFNNISVAGSTTFAGDTTFKSRLFIGNDISINGNLYVGGDLSVNGIFSGDFASGIIPTSAIIDYPISSSSNVEITGNVRVAGDASFNGTRVDLSTNTIIQLSGNVTFTDGTTLSTYVNDISSGSFAQGNVIFKDATFVSVTCNGNVSAGSKVTSSDYRVKTNVTELDGSYSVDNLVPIQYDNILSNKHEFGLIAHELQAVYPELVKGEKDGAEYQHVNYNGLIGVLVKKVQELKRRKEVLCKK
jgi:hypothetical protein